jgi:hypothetical protein
MKRLANAMFCSADIEVLLLADSRFLRGVGNNSHDATRRRKRQRKPT